MMMNIDSYPNASLLSKKQIDFRYRKIATKFKNASKKLNEARRALLGIYFSADDLQRSMKKSIKHLTSRDRERTEYLEKMCNLYERLEYSNSL